jgi:hypothetical protein
MYGDTFVFNNNMFIVVSQSQPQTELVNHFLCKTNPLHRKLLVPGHVIFAFANFLQTMPRMLEIEFNFIDAPV